MRWYNRIWYVIDLTGGTGSTSVEVVV